jgi:hypothetical protein
MRSVTNIHLVLFTFAILVSSSAIEANPVSDINRSKAKADLKAHLLDRYESSYSTVEMLMKAGMKSYDNLAKIPDNKVSNDVMEKLLDRYYPSFSTVEMLYESNMESYKRLHE